MDYQSSSRGPSPAMPPPNYDSSRTYTPSPKPGQTASLRDRNNDSSFEIARLHYEALRNYLEIDSSRDNIANQRASARDKLSRLTRNQFTELSTDVYDELQRRLKSDKDAPFLPVRKDFNPKRNQARQKLATLPKQRFKDLATDVFYEWERRVPELKQMNSMPSPPPSDYPSSPRYPQEANSPMPQPSQTGNIVPVKGTIDGNSAEAPYSSQGFNDPSMNPIKQRERSGSTSQRSRPYPDYPPPPLPNSRDRERERERERERDRDRSNGSVSSNRPTPKAKEGPGVNMGQLDNLMTDLGNMVNAKGDEYRDSSSAPGTDRDREIPSSASDYRRGSNRTTATTTASSSPSTFGRDPVGSADFERLRSEYESRISTMRRRIAQLEGELVDTTGGRREGTRLQHLEDQIAQTKQQNQQQAARLSQLQNDFDKLKVKYSSQIEVANDVRQEAQSLLEEIKELNRKNEELKLERDKDVQRIIELKREAEDWQIRYEKAKDELHSHREDNGDRSNRSDGSNQLLIATPDGVIEESKMTAYRVAVDGLIEAGRSSVSTEVLIAMKSIVVSCKSIIEDVENYEHTTDESEDALYSQKQQLSVALSGLMRAAKIHASGGGGKDSELVAAAGQLTVTVVDLVKAVGMCPSRESDNKHGMDHSRGIAGDAKQNESMREDTSFGMSMAMGGAWHSGPNGHMRDTMASEVVTNVSDSMDDLPMDDLKAYLQAQADVIVQAIQTMLKSLRASSGDLRETIDDLLQIVVRTVRVSRRCFERDAAPYRARGEGILAELDERIERLAGLQREIFASGNGDIDDKVGKQQLAGASFEIAKYTKELVALVE
ncbi:uncharacterized protein VTP21DRAFT_1617 [Calcarisporiella thermophila]|uniref:uncharacterized protein n=1 Tax=Calcarisporiella thermophila TaxID=911321 RepID=UPI0037436F35